MVLTCVYNLPDKDGPDVSQSTCNKDRKLHFISIYRWYLQKLRAMNQFFAEKSKQIGLKHRKSTKST